MKPYLDWHNNIDNITKCHKLYKGKAVRVDKLHEVIEADVEVAKHMRRWDFDSYTSHITVEQAKVNMVIETHAIRAGQGLLPDMMPVDWSQYITCFAHDVRHPWKHMPMYLSKASHEEMVKADLEQSQNVKTVAECMQGVKPELLIKYKDRIMKQVAKEEAAERPHQAAENIEHRFKKRTDNHEARIFGQPTVEDATEEEIVDNNINGGDAVYDVNKDKLTRADLINRTNASLPNEATAQAEIDGEDLVTDTLRKVAAVVDANRNSPRPVRTRTRRAAPATPATPASSSPAPRTPHTGSTSEFVPTPVEPQPDSGTKTYYHGPIAGPSRLRTSTSVDDDDNIVPDTPAPAARRPRSRAATATAGPAPATRGRGPHFCNVPDCRTRQGTYFRFGPRGDLNRHLRDVHGMTPDEAKAHDCPPGEPDDV